MAPIAGDSVGIDAESGGDLARAALALARRFAAGATMWCVAPTWPEHARHVAVEFVHPVIVGKRALPAVSIESPDTLAALRSVVRPGDVLLAISGAGSPPVAAAMRRAEAWGLTSLWIGAGSRPTAGAADHVLWLDDANGTAPFDGQMVLLYHVLWELTHVCFEHPSLLTPPSDPACEGEIGCITCSDEGRQGEVVEAVSADTVVVRSARGSETIDTTMVGPVNPGDLVLIHGGSAITVLEGAGR